jgi:hypothetical protein
MPIERLFFAGVMILCLFVGSPASSLAGDGGACCFPDGNCFIELEIDCTSLVQEAGGGFRLEFPASNGVSYQLQGNTNLPLLLPGWTHIGPQVIGPVGIILDPFAPEGFKMYRVVAE